MSCTLQIPLSEWKQWKDLNQAEEGVGIKVIIIAITNAGLD